MIINLYNLFNDKNNMPYLNIINSIEYEEGQEFITPYDTILVLCKLTKLHCSHTENVYMATYDHSKKIIGLFHVASGAMTNVNASNRIKATYMLMSGGFSFEIFHNHPINDFTPSEEDINSTYLEKALASYMEIEYLNDYIITKEGWKNINTGEKHKFSDYELKYINS